VTIQEEGRLTVNRKYLNESIKLLDDFAEKLTSDFTAKFKEV
jgi:hypothetical protein